MKDVLTTMMRASEEKHFSKPTRLTDFYFGGGWTFVEYLGKYIFSKSLRLLDNLILMQ